MKRSAIPGLLLAVIGIIIFARQDIMRFMQNKTEMHATRIRQSEATLKAEQAFPLASLLAGFFFMSGVGLVAVSAHPVDVTAQESPDSQAE